MAPTDPDAVNSALTIRAAEPSDVDALTELANLPGVRRGTLRLPFTTRATIEARLQTPGVHVLVAEREGAVIAQAFLGRQQGRRAHVGAIGIFVHDDHVGRGVGGALMDALLDLADNWMGLRRIELSVNVDNASAIRLYERLGFVREGTRRGDILRDGVLVDSYMMARLRDAPPLMERSS